MLELRRHVPGVSGQPSVKSLPASPGSLNKGAAKAQSSKEPISNFEAAGRAPQDPLSGLVPSDSLAGAEHSAQTFLV